MKKDVDFNLKEVFIIFSILFICSIPLIIWVIKNRSLGVMDDISLILIDIIYLLCLSITIKHILYTKSMIKLDNCIELGNGRKFEMFIAIIVIFAYVMYVINGIYGDNIMSLIPIAVTIFLLEVVVNSNITLIGDRFIIHGIGVIQIEAVKSWDVFDKSNIVRLNLKDGKTFEIIMSSKFKAILLQKIVK
ncbi:MAG: hypothetical protein Q8936_12625 [Bacillota bacterium]|nr:hypothetical protein [Bacillota bacterium]